MKNFVQVYIITKQIVTYLLMVQKFTNLKKKVSDIVASPLCLGNISKDWLTDNMKKKTGFKGYIYDFSVDYDLLMLMVLKTFINI